MIKGKANYGLHWVTGTRFNAKYRIADPDFRGGKTVHRPNAKGGTTAARYDYGQAVSKKQVRYGRELFRPTHIQSDQCPQWGDIFTFTP